MHAIEKAAFLLRKWNDPNEGLSTQELKTLRVLLSEVRDEVSEAIALRVEEENCNNE